MNLIGIEFARLYQFFHFSHGYASRATHHRIEITGCSFKNKVTGFIAFPGFYKGKIGLESSFEHVHFAVEIPGFFVESYFGAVTRRRVDGRESLLSRLATRCQCSLRN